MELRGRKNGHDIPRATEHNWHHDLSCADCGCPISNGHTRCRPCSIRHRIEVQVTIPSEEYLQPTPEGMELILYPRMAMSKRGERQARRLVRKRLEKYFARKRREDAVRDPVKELIHIAWMKDFA